MTNILCEIARAFCKFCAESTGLTILFCANKQAWNMHVKKVRKNSFFALTTFLFHVIIIKIYFKEYNPIIDSQSMTTTVTLIDKDQKFFVVALGE